MERREERCKDERAVVFSHRKHLKPVAESRQAKELP